LTVPQRKAALAAAGRAYVAREHSPVRFLRALDSLLREALV